MKKILLLAFLGIYGQVGAQSYFPPLVGSQWDTLSPARFGIRQSAIDSAINFLASYDTKAFIVLKDGKILHEHYFGSFTVDSAWYWASAGKSLTAFGVGMAQFQGRLSIQDSSSRYLGTGWTSLTPAQEGQIKIWHQLTMTSGLNDGVPDDNCDSPACLQYLAPVGTRWAYHNAPYRLLHDVVGASANQSWQAFFNQQISARTGISGLWIDHVLYSKARSMARFGLLMLNKGVWNGDVLLGDTAYLNAMIRPSQNLNKSYGYLWWLNGQDNFMMPQSQIQFSGSLIPAAPAELVMGLGKNDQKLYLLPSRNIVVIRMGNGSNLPVPVLFDRDFWNYLPAILPANGLAVSQTSTTAIKAYPNPASTSLQLELPEGRYTLSWFDLSGKKVATVELHGTQVTELPSANGLYLLVAERIETGERFHTRIAIQHP